MRFSTSILATSILISNVFSHPGEDHSAELAERGEFLKLSRKNLDHCAEKFKARGIEQRSIARRTAIAQKARQKRGLSLDAPYLRARQDAVDTDHESSIDYNSDTSASVLFASNGSCILSPEVTQGPYYVEGEYVRENITENQEGVDLILDAQVVDVTTCEPVTNAVLEIWACNSTGVYSGIVASGNGVGTADPSNINNTALRGLQPTDADGVAKFETLFPGHYTGRATHIHIMVHFNGTTFENGTYAGGYVSHVGQLFFDQSLITKVEGVAPYSTNTQDITENSSDSILSQETANGHDPFVEYSLLSDDVSAGVFGWISFGIDLTSQQTITGAATLTQNGGVANSGSNGGGMGGGGGGGPRPSGTGTGSAPPSGTGTGSTVNGTTSTSGAPASTSSLIVTRANSGGAGAAVSSALVFILGVFWLI